MEEKILIEFENVSFVEGDNTVFDEINVQIFQNDIFVILGRSGDGKSTFLKLCAGMLMPTDGKIKIGGKNLADLSEEMLYKLRHEMGFVFQHGGLLNNMNVYANVALPLRYHTDLDENTISSKIKEKLDFVGWKGKNTDFPWSLSLSQKKQVGIARALSTKPEMIFYDEPVEGLDTNHQRMVQEIIKNTGITTVVTTHDLSCALNVSNRIAVIENKKIVVLDKEEIKQKYVVEEE